MICTFEHRLRPSSSVRHAALVGLVALGLGLSGACSSGGGGGADQNPPPALGKNAKLSDLQVAPGSITFSPQVSSYDVVVGALDVSVAVTATAADPAASITVAGQPALSGVTKDVALTGDPTLIEVVVTAENGQNVRTYELHVYLGSPPGDNAELASLTISFGGTSLDLDPADVDKVYPMAVGFLAAQVVVTATPVDPGATLSVAGQPAAWDEPRAVELVQNANQIPVTVTAEDGVNVLTYTLGIYREPASLFAQEAYAKASNAQAADFFGMSVALDGDTLAVGAPGEDSNATGIDGNQLDDSAALSGAVYVFTFSAGVWTQQAYIKASNSQAFDRFGERLALDGDTLAVSAIGESSSATGIDGDESDDSAAGSGAVYVFTRTAGVWSQQAYVKASNTDAGDEFGFAVAVEGDTLAVGAHREDSFATGIDGDGSDNSASASGAAYVFTRSAGVWTQQAYLKASNTDAGDDFGQSLALSGDTLAVGALKEASGAIGVGGDQGDNSLVGSGAVYVFQRSAGVWAQQAYLKASNSDKDDYFGSSLALDGDTLAAGALYEDSVAIGVDGSQGNSPFAQQSGAVYVFTRSAGVWSQQAYVKASNTDAADEFGGSVALSGNTLVVGANGESSNAVGIGGSQFNDSQDHSGAAYVFVRSAGLWSQKAYVKASNTQQNDTFGMALALDGEALVIGANLEDSDAVGIGGNQSSNAAPNAGAVYAFR